MPMISQFLTPHKWPIVALLLSCFMLIGAWVFQYGFGYAPCQMCYWQRHAHKAVIGVAVIGVVFSYLQSSHLRLINALIALALLLSAALGFWHMGVEFGWWEGPKTCLSGGFDLDDMNADDIFGALNQPISAGGCSEAAWHFLGLSMAGWNFVISGLGAIISANMAFKKSA